MREFLKYHRMPLLFLISCCGLYFSFAYDFERSDLPKLLMLYFALFFLSWKMFQMESSNLRFLISAAVLFRLVHLFALPELSPDFYRFLWDGKLLLHRISPYLHTPAELMAMGRAPMKNAGELISGMGELSAGNYSNYPPLNQLLFALSAMFSGKGIWGGILSMRLILIAAEIGIFYFGRKLLKAMGLPENRIFWFLLNPLIIIELTGNLHFEGVMIFFLLWAIYLLHRGKWAWSAVILALSVSVKLIPLLFLPLLFTYFLTNRDSPGRRLNITKLCLYYLILGLIVFLSFLPFLQPGFLSNYSESLSLWFQKFNFNASTYYVVRWVGYQTEGYNIIGSAGKMLSLLALILILIIAIFRKNRTTENLFYNMLWAIVVYYFLATTVHPWYLALPLILSIFTRYKFPKVWTLVVVFSYAAYTQPGFSENLWLVAAEYLVVFGFLGKEIFEVTSNKKLLKRR